MRGLRVFNETNTSPTFLYFSGLNENEEPGIYASLVIPTLLVGTVGGGTGTPTAKECLDVIGCSGKV